MKSRMKKASAVIMTLVTVAISGVMAFAAEPVNITTVMETSFSKVVTDLLSMIAAILPVGLTIFGATIAVAFAIKWFKRLVKA